MSTQARELGVELALPADLAGLEVDVVHHPAMDIVGADVVVLVVEAGDWLLLVASADGRSQEDVVAPDDR